MNQNLTLGALTFLVWSSFSTWYYVCQIKGLCFEEIRTSTEVSDAKPSPESVTAKESVVVEPKKEEPKPLPAIDLNEEKRVRGKRKPKAIKSEKLKKIFNNLYRKM